MCDVVLVGGYVAVDAHSDMSNNRSVFCICGPFRDAGY